MAAPVIQSQKQQVVTRTAAKRAAPPQRYLNRASGKMETAQQMHSYRAPAGRPAPVHAPAPAPAQQPVPQQPSLIQMSPAQIEDRAKRIVNSELAAERLPFQQRQTQLTGEQAGVQAAHTTNYQQLDAGIAAQQAAQATSAKTFQNVAADQVKKAEGPAPGSAETAEHLGGAPEAGSSAARQQEAARTLLSAIAASAQGGTNQRQQAETDFLTNARVTGQQQAAAGSTQIASDYGKSKQTTANEEARLLATKAGRVGKLFLNTEGEQEKLRIAAGGLNIKADEAARHSEETRSNVSNRRETQAVNRSKLANEGKKVANEGRKIAADEAYKRATAGEKRTKDSLDVKKKEIEIKNALEKNPNKSTLTPLKVDEMSGEAAKVFNVFRRARENGATPAQIREAITRGYFRRVPSKKEAEEKKKPYNEKTGVNLKQPIWLDVAEQIMQKEYVDAPTKQRLREMGLPDNEWSNHFLGGPGNAQRQQGGSKRTFYKPKGQ